MQKALLTLIGLFVAGTYSLAAPPNSINSARVKYPYSLIGKDFGVLNESDLAANTCDVHPRLFALGSDSSYWRCFESKDVVFSCDSNGTADPNEGVMGLIVLEATDKSGQHEYIARRPWPIAECREFGSTFAVKIAGTQHICISGSSPGKSTDPSETKTTVWIFEKYKTTKGCESYFDGECDLTRLIKRGCKTNSSASR